MVTMPVAWLHMVQKYKGRKPPTPSPSPILLFHLLLLLLASCVLASSRTLSGCISLANHRELRDVSLQGVRMLLLEDGANPCTSRDDATIHVTLCSPCCTGSLASSDLFYESYAPKGLTREALCPCSGSPAALTVSLRR